MEALGASLLCRLVKKPAPQSLGGAKSKSFEAPACCSPAQRKTWPTPASAFRIDSHEAL